MFYTLYYFWSFFFSTILARKSYIAKTDTEKAYYLSTWTANVHHLFIFVYSAYQFLANSSCEGAYPLIWMKDETCFLTVQKEFVYAGFITMGYLAYDYIIQKYYVADTSPLGQQTLWHHINGCTGLLIGMSSGYGITGVACFSLLVEISTIFLNYRSMYSKERMGDFIP